MFIQNHLSASACASPSRPKTILVVGQDTLLNSAVQRLLGSRADWQVTSVPGSIELTELLVEIRRVRPQVVVSSQDRDAHLLAELVFTHPSQLMLILVSTEHNGIEVYSKRSLWIKEAADFLAVVDQA